MTSPASQFLLRHFLCVLCAWPQLTAGLFYEYVPECARDGVHFGAGLGAVAGGVTGAAALTGTGLGGASLAMCPTLGIATLAGTGGSLLGGPFMPLGGMLAGALFGGLAGGSTGGYIHCKRAESEQATKAIDYYIENHPEGYKLESLRDTREEIFSQKAVQQINSALLRLRVKLPQPPRSTMSYITDPTTQTSTNSYSSALEFKPIFPSQSSASSGVKEYPSLPIKTVDTEEFFSEMPYKTSALLESSFSPSKPLGRKPYKRIPSQASPSSSTGTTLSGQQLLELIKMAALNEELKMLQEEKNTLDLGKRQLYKQKMKKQKHQQQQQPAKTFSPKYPLYLEQVYPQFHDSVEPNMHMLPSVDPAIRTVQNGPQLQLYTPRPYVAQTPVYQQSAEFDSSYYPPLTGDPDYDGDSNGVLVKSLGPIPQRYPWHVDEYLLSNRHKPRHDAAKKRKRRKRK